jgi:cytochrome c biogenesis protein CcmG, thiol:disulfide interchange protein DsbE
VSKHERLKKAAGSGMATLALGLGLVLVAVAGFFAIPQAAEQVREAEGLVVPAPVNYPAPGVSLTGLDGAPVSLTITPGRLFYNAWATWCPPCRAEMPILQAYYEKHRDKGFVIIAIEDGLQGDVSVDEVCR